MQLSFTMANTYSLSTPTKMSQCSVQFAPRTHAVSLPKACVLILIFPTWPRYPASHCVVHPSTAPKSPRGHYTLRATCTSPRTHLRHVALNVVHVLSNLITSTTPATAATSTTSLSPSALAEEQLHVTSL